MTELSSHAVTHLLLAWSDGDQSALEKLTPLVYAELHKIAKRHMRREGENHTLQATALVGALTTRFTIVFSPTPLTSPSFLAAPTRGQLTPAEREEWEAFQRRLDHASQEAIAGSPGVKVTVRSEITDRQTVVFDITIKKSG